MADVILFPGMTTLPIEADRILENSLGKLETVIVIGVTPEGNFYFAASDPDGSQTLWWLERAKHALMKITDKLEDGTL